MRPERAAVGSVVSLWLFALALPAALCCFAIEAPLMFFYSFAVIALAALPTAAVLEALVRRANRRFQTGRCTACGYDLSGLPMEACCPECGTAPPVPR